MLLLSIFIQNITEMPGSRKIFGPFLSEIRTFGTNFKIFIYGAIHKTFLYGVIYMFYEK